MEHREVGPITRLALADGAVFAGPGFGAADEARTVTAEVVFNTALTGYQEALTDPSYAGQILVMTAPLMGNYGVNPEDLESGRAQVSGFVVRELARRHSNYRADSDLSAWLRRSGIVGLSGVDTRAITRRLRSAGVMPGIISSDASLSDAELVRRAQAAPKMDGQNLAALASCSSKQSWRESVGAEWELLEPKTGAVASRGGKPLRVLALDCGAKRNILRLLTRAGCEVTVAPWDTPASEIRAMHGRGEIDGLFISNGPGDPAAVEQTIGTLRDLVSDPRTTIPTFGICLGHQLLALALGAKTYKLKFGHRGVNQPVRNLMSGQVEITSQNHGFAVDEASLRAAGGESTHVNLNDRSLAGFRMPDRPVFAVQHHPEASPGPHDAAYLFDQFVRMMQTGRPAVLAGSAGGASAQG